jgi:hypothetical protein
VQKRDDEIDPEGGGDEEGEKRFQHGAPQTRPSARA